MFASSRLLHFRHRGHQFAKQLYRKVPWKIVGGVAVATPCIALLQGTLLLHDYRQNHGNAPLPDVPSRGLVVVSSSSNNSESNAYSQPSPSTMPLTKLNVNHQLATNSISTINNDSNHDNSVNNQQSNKVIHQRIHGEIQNDNHLGTNSDEDDMSTLLTTSTLPLRILIIGDSLAAGVGTSRSSTPILPETIAQALSKALGGRAVLWTCFGVPGQTSSEIVHTIQHLEDIFTHTTKNHATLLQRFNEWQAQQRQNAQHRIESAKRKTKEWIEQRRSNNDDDQLTNGTNKSNRFLRWWKRTRMQIRNDIQSLRSILNREDNPCVSDDKTLNDRDTNLQSTLEEQATIGKYDIAIVLTGLNDLKESLLPFMRSSERTKVLKQYKLEQRQQSTDIPLADTEYDNDMVCKEQGMKGELILILNALLESRMLTKNSIDIDQTKDNDTSSCKEQQTVQEKGPLIVFPALPYQPTVLSQHVPLSWFMIPLLNMVDQNKKILSELYPGLVLYVESPDINDWSDATLAKHGTIWEDFRVLFKLNDIAQDAKERIEQLMKRHYERWVCDVGVDDTNDESNLHNSMSLASPQNEDDSLYEFDAFGNVVNVQQQSLSRKRTTNAQPGSIMVAADGIHPSDIGYDMWGRHIADAIIKEWGKLDNSKNHDKKV